MPLVAMVALVLLPVASSLHTYPSLHVVDRSGDGLGHFELTFSDASNKNGPDDDDTRPIPTSGPDAADFPAAFRPAVALADKLQDGSREIRPGYGLVFDHVMTGSTVETGRSVPYHYFLANAVAQSRTTPTSMHLLWVGYWNDHDGDGVIHDGFCLSSHSSAPHGDACGASYPDEVSGWLPPQVASPRLDEFIWRGQNTGEALIAAAWIFPGDYDGAGATGSHLEPSGLAGDCARFTDSVNCMDPRPDMTFSDQTDPRVTSNANQQRWTGGNGGGQWTPEEFLIVTQQIVTLIGPEGLIRNASMNTVYNVALTSGDFFRDYDWYQSSLPLLEPLYLSALRSDTSVATLSISLSTLWREEAMIGHPIH